MSDLLKHKFADYEPEPERDLWAGIETQLHPRQGSFRPFKWQYWAVAAGIVMVLGVSIVFMQKEGATNPTSSKQEIVAIDKKIDTAQNKEAQVNTNVNQTPTAENTLVKAQEEPSLPPSSSNPNLKQRTKTYIVKVTESYQEDKNGVAQNPIITKVEKQQVDKPVIIAPAPKEEKQEQSILVSTVQNAVKQAEAQPKEREEWIVYEMPTKKKKEIINPKQTIFPQNQHNDVLNLNQLSMEEVAAFSTEKLNRVVNSPIKVNRNSDNTVYEVNLGGIKIKHKSPKKVEREY